MAATYACLDPNCATCAEFWDLQLGLKDDVDTYMSCVPDHCCYCQPYDCGPDLPMGDCGCMDGW